MGSRVELSRKLLRLAKAVEQAKAKSEKAAFARASIPPGSSRARVTTANARWSRAAEERDRRERAFLEQVELIAKVFRRR